MLTRHRFHKRTFWQHGWDGGVTNHFPLGFTDETFLVAGKMRGSSHFFLLGGDPNSAAQAYSGRMVDPRSEQSSPFLPFAMPVLHPAGRAMTFFWCAGRSCGTELRNAPLLVGKSGHQPELLQRPSFGGQVRAPARVVATPFFRWASPGFQPESLPSVPHTL